MIEKLGMHLEDREQLAPLAARILSTLILVGKKGITFDGLVKNLGASKSTISTHLNNLQSTHRITYFTLTGDRKKYFILPHDSMLQWIENTVEKWDREKEIHLDILVYKKECNAAMAENPDEKFEVDIHKEYLQFLEQACQSMAALRKRINTD